MPPQKGDVKSARQWLDSIQEYRKAFRRWMMVGKRIVDRYRLEKSRAFVDLEHGRDETLHNILWANVQTMRPALFSQEPTIYAERRHGDKDLVGRLAGQVIERLINVENEENGFMATFDAVVLDVLLPGRGVPWVRFKQTGQDERSVSIDYVHWTDFAHSPERNWADVARRGWVARRQSMTKAEGKARFGAKFDDVKLTMERRQTEDMQQNDRAESQEMKYAEVWEVWDVPSRKRLFLAEGLEKPLQETDDPYRLKRFFPCPRPAYATLTNEDLEPTADYLQYIGQAEELDEISARIRALTEALKMVGVYDSSAQGIGDLLQSNDGTMVPVDNMASIISKGQGSGGGLTGVIAFMPLKEIAETLTGLYASRERIKALLYEVSGVSDIIRGQVDPREKASQSQIKAQFASKRLERRRRSVERCARDTARIAIEVVLELYPSDTLRLQSGFDMLPEIQGMEDMSKQQAWMAVEQLLRNDKLRGFRVDVETDSTIALDEGNDSEQRNQFLQSAGNFLNQALPVMQASPDLVPVMGEMLLFAIRGSRAGRTLEAKFTEAVDGMAQRVQKQQADEQAAAQQAAQAQAEGQPPEGGPPPDPVAEAKAGQIQQQAQIDGQQAQISGQQAQIEGQKAQVELQMLQAKADFEQQKYALELQKLQIQAQQAAQPPVVPDPGGIQ